MDSIIEYLSETAPSISTQYQSADTYRDKLDKLEQGNSILLQENIDLEFRLKEIEHKLKENSAELTKSPYKTEEKLMTSLARDLKEQILEVEQLFYENMKTIQILSEKINETHDTTKKVDELIRLLSREERNKERIPIMDDYIEVFSDSSLLDLSSVIADDYMASAPNSDDSEGIKLILKTSMNEMHPYSSSSMKNLHSRAFLSVILPFNF